MAKISECKKVLKSAKIGAGFNLYADEPTPAFHYAAIEKGKGDEAISALTAAGIRAFLAPGCSHTYADNIQIYRK